MSKLSICLLRVVEEREGCFLQPKRKSGNGCTRGTQGSRGRSWNGVIRETMGDWNLENVLALIESFGERTQASGKGR